MIVVDPESWPPALSDGLVSACHDCGRVPVVDYTVDDDEWDRIARARSANFGVLCLDCFVARGGDVAKIEMVQIVGDGVTALFNPVRAYRWGP